MLHNTNEYDIKMKIGNTNVYIIKPKITEEERQRRLRSLEKTIESIFNCKCTLRIVPEE